MTTHFRPLWALAATVSWLAGCASQPGATTISHGGFSLTLPHEFVDDTDYFLQSALLDPSILAVNTRMGQHFEPILAFSNRSRHRTQGGCMLIKRRLTPKSEVHTTAARDLARSSMHHFNAPKPQLEPLRPLSPLRPLQGIQTLESRPVDMAGLSAWQETWQVRWAQQPGAYQTASRLSVMVADLGPQPTTGDRTLLQAACYVSDLEGYLGTAMQDVMAAMNTLKAAP